MPEFKLQQSPDPFSVEVATDVSSPRRGDELAEWRAELDSYYAQMQKFEAMDPVEVFMKLSAYSARVSEIRSQVVRSATRRLGSFRTQEIDPFLEECERQFKLHSRIQAIREMEFRISGGAM